MYMGKLLQLFSHEELRPTHVHGTPHKRPARAQSLVREAVVYAASHLMMWQITKQLTLTYSLIKFCDLKIRSVEIFTQFFTTSGQDYTDLGWFLNKNINFNKPRRPCPLGIG
jgi:hypothetical protein